MRRAVLALAAVFTVLAASGCTGGPSQAGPSTVSGSAAAGGSVTLTWLSVTNWLVEAGGTRVLLDGYLTRLDRRLVEADGTSRGTAVTDTAELRRLLRRAGADLRLDWILVGHGHWDHAFDVPAIARMTGARIAGARTVCLQVAALGLEPDRCTVVEGGEMLELGPGVRVRVVRWHHSGDPATEAGRRLSSPLELRRRPDVDPRTGGLRPGYLEDYPNGGGSRAYLLVVDAGTSGEDPVTVFWSNTANAAAWAAPLRADTAWLRGIGVDMSNLVAAESPAPTRAHLAEAMAAEEVASVDAWLGFPGAEHVRQVVPVLRPRTFIPHHWDDFWTPMTAGVGTPFDARQLRPYLDSAGVELGVPTAYFQQLPARGEIP